MAMYVNVKQDTLEMIVRQVDIVFEIFSQLIECKFHVRLPIPVDFTHISSPFTTFHFVYMQVLCFVSCFRH